MLKYNEKLQKLVFLSFEYLDFFDFHLHPPLFAYVCSDKENSIILLNNRRMGPDP
jgi:hypothetical protein